MTIPVIVTATREALASVPQSFRDACWNMGATKWQTIRTIVLPNSVSGILTGVILEISRAAGETAPILFTGATAAVAINTSDLGTKLMPYDLDDRFIAYPIVAHCSREDFRDARRNEVWHGSCHRFNSCSKQFFYFVRRILELERNGNFLEFDEHSH